MITNKTQKIIFILKKKPEFFYFLRKIRHFIGAYLLKPQYYSSIKSKIHFNDLMFNKNCQEEYQKVGENAYDLIYNGLRLANGHGNIESLLDFGCGYGRVTRVLAKNIGSQKISVFDVDKKAVEFCASEFKVTPLYLNRDWQKIPFKNYNIIWVGSVFTHLSEVYLKDMILLLIEHLTDNGLLIFTTLGEENLSKLKKGKYGLNFMEKEAKIKEEFNKNGFSFTPYGYYKDKNIGLTFIKYSFITELISKISQNGLKLIKFYKNGWDNHQDVFVYQKCKF